MYIDGQWYRLNVKDSIVPDDVVGRLDVSVLQDNVLAPILGIQDPRTDQRIMFIGESEDFQSSRDWWMTEWQLHFPCILHRSQSYLI